MADFESLSKGKAKPSTPKPTTINAAENTEQKVKRTTGADRLEKEADQSARNHRTVRAIAEASRSKTQMKKPPNDHTLHT